MEQEREMEVERDNRLLVSRIARTMAKGGLDNWNEDYEVLSKNRSLKELIPLVPVPVPQLVPELQKNCVTVIF